MHRRSGDVDRQRLIDGLSAWREDLQPATDEEAIQAIIQRPPWGYDRLAANEAADLDDNAWEPHYQKAAGIVARNPQLLRTLESWLVEQAPESAMSLGVVLASHAGVQAVVDVIQDWLREDRVPSLCAGFCSKLRELQGDLPQWVVSTLDSALEQRPGSVARMTCVIDPTLRGVERVFRCARIVGANQAEVFGRLFGYHWKGVLTPEREAAALATLRNAPEFTPELQRTFVHLLRMYLHTDKNERLPDELVPEVQFIVEHPPTEAGGHAEHDWQSFALRLAHTNPISVLHASVTLAVTWRARNNFANGEAIEVLTTLAAERPKEVMEALIEALASEEVQHFINLERWQELFARFDPLQLEARVEPLGIAFIRELGAVMPDPAIEAGKVKVPAVTEWYLRKHGADDECLKNFELGRWSGRVRTGWAWQRTSEVERDTALYLKYPLPALQRWASIRLERQRFDAERDRVTYEEMNNRE